MELNKEQAKENLKVVKFNNMAKILDKMSDIEDGINSCRIAILRGRMNNQRINRNDLIISYFGFLQSYYMQIYGDLSSKEIEDIDTTFTELQKIMNNVANSTYAAETRCFTSFTDKAFEAEKLLRLLAKAHGFSTINIIKDMYATMSN